MSLPENYSYSDDHDGDPFTAGWLFEVEVTEVGPLLTAAEYAEKNGV